MSTYCKILKAVLTIALCFSLTFPAEAAGSESKRVKRTSPVTLKNTPMKNSFDTPDFAYPKDVAKNAKAEYDKALASGDGLNALRAAIQLNIAEISIDAEGDVKQSIERYSELGKKLMAPWNSLAYLLKGDLYSQIYDSNRWSFDNRKLPLDSVPENIQEWSGDMFAVKTMEAVRNAMESVGPAGKNGLKEIAGLLYKAEGAEKAGMTVEDFIILKGGDIISSYCRNYNGVPLRFGNNTQSMSLPEQCAELRGSLFEIGLKNSEAAGNIAMASLFAFRKYQLMSYLPERRKFLDECFDKFGDTEWGADFVYEYAADIQNRPGKDGKAISNDESNALRRKALNILTDYNKKYPDAPSSNSLVNAIANYRERRVRVNMPEKLLPASEVKCGLTSTNVYDYKLLLYKLPDVIDEYVQFKDLSSKGKLVRTIPVSVTGTTPDIINDSVVIQGMDPGNYVLLPSVDGTLAGVIRDKNDKYSGMDMFQVTDLAYFIVSDDKGKRLFIVDAHNQRPLQGIKVRIEEKVYRGKGQVWNFVTDSDGSVAMPDKQTGNVKFRAVRGASYVSNQFYVWSRGSEQTESNYIGQVLSDLSIYKPGQNLGFVGILGLKDGHKLSEVKHKDVIFRLYNANNQQVDTLVAKTDDKGRACGEFTIPTGGLLGDYRVQMVVKEPNGEDKWIAACQINVADYKSPTFKVITEKLGSQFILGDTLNVVGKAVTYSGMPVTGGKVVYTVKYSPWRYWWGSADNDAEFTGKTETDSNGSFNIELPTETIRNTPYERGVFVLTVAVTDMAGETREAEPVRFSFASAYSLNAEIDNLIRVDGNVSDIVIGSIRLTDMIGYPVDKAVYYSVKNKRGLVAATGNLKPGEFKLDVSKMASGEYTVSFALNPEMKTEDDLDVTESSFTIWRPVDKTPAFETPLWVPVQNITAVPGQKTVEVPIGSSYSDSYIYCCVDNGVKQLNSEWIRISDGIVRINVPTPDALSRVYVNLIGMHDMDSRIARVTVVPEVQTEKVEISTESFRDRMAPGDEELWKFRFTVNGKPLVQRPVMAVMSNQALNALSPFRWSMNLENSLYWNPMISLDYRHIGSCVNTFISIDRLKDNHTSLFAIPDINTYSRSLYIGAYGEIVYNLNAAPTALMLDEQAAEAPKLRIRGTRTMGAAQSKMNASVKSEMVEEESADAYYADEGSGSVASKEELRPVELPLAFFMPDLLTDGEGVATVNFMVPNFNGTWQFQIAGYTSDLKGSVKTCDVVAAKQVMVQMNAPRFLRTGDKAMISAVLYNNSGTTLPVGGRIDILDTDGNILKSEEFAAEALNAAGQRTVTIDYTVPANLSEVEIRAYAVGGKHRDGEGSTVAVLPSSTPVIESKPFYAPPGQGTIKVDVPKNVEDATVTLQYCGNPIWECVTALPSILAPESTNILAQVNALYGNAIARGLIRDYPQIAQALKTFSDQEHAGDSTLVSNLEKNQQLKAVALDNTPWVNNAKDETRRMQSLVEYLDVAKSEAAISAVMKVLGDRQNNDGGWSWCPGMPTSSYITGRVLLHFAMLKGMGYLPEGAEKMARKAFGYVDRELAQDWERTDRKYFSVTGLLNYLYVKSFFPNVKDAKAFEPLRNRAMKAIASDWKKFSIYDKATAVTLEHRLNNARLAGDILESLRQYAKVSPEKGMCFENLKGTWSGWNPLITTAQVLEAYGEAAPEDSAVDLLRQWLLMSKQTQDWGSMQGTAEVVQALLSTGSDWTAPGEAAKVLVSGEVVEIPSRAAITDSFTVTLTREQVKKDNIEIVKNSAGPAWGGVVSQYVAPILDVKSEGIPQLRVEKNIYSIKDGDAVAGDLKVGDRVRVTISVTTDRDMDYVAIVDNRSACLEPVDQLSGYAASDGVWMYREVRNTQTNLFIPFLPKGTSVISYECFVDRAGEYTLGIAQAQSQYSPVITAHSAGVKLIVE